MDQQPSSPQHPQPVPFIKIGIYIAAIIVVIGVVVGVTSLINQGRKAKEAADISAHALKVGAYPYLYACTALTRSDIIKAGAKLKDDKLGESASTTEAIPYDQIPQLDLLKTIEDPLFSGSLASTCEYQQTDLSSFDQKRIKVTVNQFPAEALAKKNFEAKKSSQKGVPFASLKETSWIESKSATNDNAAITADILLTNSVVELKYDMGNIEHNQAATKLDSLALTITKNLSNLAVSTKPYDFSGINSIEKSALIDACRAINFSKINDILGNIHYDQTQVRGEHNYAKLSDATPAISSQCSVNYRYKDDDAKQPDFKKQKYAESQTRFPNTIALTIATYPTEQAARSSVTNLPVSLSVKSGITPTTFTYGDTSFAYEQSSNVLGFDSQAHHFMTVHKTSVIDIMIEEGSVKTPYNSTVKSVTSEQAKRLLDVVKLP